MKIDPFASKHRLVGAILLLASSLAEAPVAAQEGESSPPPGIEIRRLDNFNVSPDCLSTPLRDDEYLTFAIESGTDPSRKLVQRSESGVTLRAIADFPLFPFPFGPLVFELDPSRTAVYVCEPVPFGQITRIDLADGESTVIADLPTPFDVTFDEAGALLVCGSADLIVSHIDRVDPVTGAVDPIYRDSAAYFLSVDLTSEGDLLAATRKKIYRWDSDLVHSGELLALDSAVVESDGFSFLRDIVVDRTTDTLYAYEGFPDLAHGAYLVRESKAESTWLGAGSSWNDACMKIRPGTAGALLAPYQTSRVNRLVVTNVDLFSGLYDRYEIQGQRPCGKLSGPGTAGAGTVDYDLVAGPPDGVAYGLFGPSRSFRTPELAISLLALEAPLYLGLDPQSLEVDLVPIELDSNGAGRRSFQNPGGLGGTLAIQALCFDSSGSLVQIAEAAFL